MRILPVGPGIGQKGLMLRGICGIGYRYVPMAQYSDPPEDFKSRRKPN
jgi:hypothetical protein